jgi:hypothetical protein
LLPVTDAGEPQELLGDQALFWTTPLTIVYLPHVADEPLSMARVRLCRQAGMAGNAEGGFGRGPARNLRGVVLRRPA